jgi:aspartate carbamoyltransferase catalytic subunit
VIKASEEKKNLPSFPLDAVYITPSSPHQLAMMPRINFELELKSGVDALYVTRPQKERFAKDEGRDLESSYTIVNKKLLEGKEFKKTMVMHPLPRVDELAYDVDADPRSMYFKQAAHGVPIRMALLALLLGVQNVNISNEPAFFEPRTDFPVYNRGYGVTCPNPVCISTQASEKNYLKPEFKIVNFEPLTLRCVYCEHGFEPKFVASAEWHEGKQDSKKYHSADSYILKKIKPENLIIFNTASDAEAHGFQPSHYAENNEEKK